MATDIKLLRDLAYARSGGLCERCGIPLADSWALHHRKLKSRGGENNLSNLVCLHHSCHNGSTSSVHNNPTKATEDGFMVASWVDPADVPIALDDGSKVLLTEDGFYRKVEDGNDW